MIRSRSGSSRRARGRANAATESRQPSLARFDVAQLFVLRHPGTRPRWARSPDPAQMLDR